MQGCSRYNVVYALNGIGREHGTQHVYILCTNEHDIYFVCYSVLDTLASRCTDQQ